MTTPNTPLPPEEILERVRALGVTDDEFRAGADAVQRKAATDAIPLEARASALRVAGSTARQVYSDLGGGGDVPTEYVAANAATMPSPRLPRYPVDLQHYAAEIAQATEARNYGHAELLARWFAYACDSLGNPDAPDPAPFDDWAAGSPADEVTELRRRQVTDAERVREANASPRITREFATLSRAQQVQIKRQYKPGETVHVGRDYVRVPETDSLEALLGGGLEAGDTELGDIPGLDHP